ncbi:MAG: TonB-dependent receptor [Candidatus Marinimicrobia bacterium]|nr:TonB-dependent receptor [Candidatus Neomarinimicrobiota bacterium]
MKKLCRISLILLIGAQFLYSGTAGKLTGRVTDQSTGEALIGVNVFLPATSQGGATDLDGNFYILNIAPGEYQLRCSMIGYSEQVIDGIRIMIDLTTTQDVQMTLSIIEGDVVTVTADRSMIQADITHAQANISSAELEALPVESFQAAVSLQAGVVVDGAGAIHIRGGRSSEVAYLIDGIPVTNSYGQNMGVGIENNAIQELQVISGTFNAEYGQAMSGIINIITKDGSLNDYSGELSYRYGRYISTDPGIYLGIIPGDLALKDDIDITKVDIFGTNQDVFTPQGRHDFQWSMSGPVPGLSKSTSFFTSGRYEDLAGRLYGVRRFNTDSFYWDNTNSMPIENGEYFSDYIDYGQDGCPDEYENGTGGCASVPLNLGGDPNGDNWDFYLNPNGGEGNSIRDGGESGNGLWDGGDRVYPVDPDVYLDDATGIWYRDVDGNGEWNSDADTDVGFPEFTYEDIDGNGALSGEWYFDGDQNGEWTNMRGDNAVVPLYNSKSLNLQGKLTHRFSQKLKLSLNVLYGSSQTYNSNALNWKYTPEGRATSYGTNMNIGLVLQHTLSPEAFYSIKASILGNFGRSYYEPIYDVNWNQLFMSNMFTISDFDMPADTSYDTNNLEDYENDNNILDASVGQKFNLGGISKYHLYRMTRSQLIKFDMTNQVNKMHQLQGGLEYKYTSIFRRDFSIIYDPAEGYSTPQILTPNVSPSTPTYSEMIKHPSEFAVYLQDKIEVVDMIVNAGIRYEIFDPDGVTPSDPADPNPRSPLKLVNRFHDTDGDGQISEDEAIDTNAKTLEDRMEYWFKEASKKVQFSPRLAMAYPITDKGVLHFSYGHFFQIPSYTYLYINPDFEVPAGGSIASATMGNADLEPQKTVQYEVGFQQQFGENIGVDVTGFYKDISNLLGSKIVTTYTNEVYGVYVNRDYGNVKGITVSLTKRLSQGFSANIDYTYSVAEGNASDPRSAFWDAQNNRDSEKQLVYLDWDQRHTLNGSVLFKLPFKVNLSFIGEYGSGLPYTPTSLNLVGGSFENSGRRPTKINVDMRISKKFAMLGREIGFTANVYNLLDIRNEVSVYSDTGRSGYSLIPTYTTQDPGWNYNTLEEYLNRPSYYSSPRQIRIGISTSL